MLLIPNIGPGEADAIIWVGVMALGWPMVSPLDWTAGVVIMGVCVGIVAGLYPGWCAVNSDPIVALSSE